MVKRNRATPILRVKLCWIGPSLTSLAQLLLMEAAIKLSSVLRPRADLVPDGGQGCQWAPHSASKSTLLFPVIFTWLGIHWIRIRHPFFWRRSKDSLQESVREQSVLLYRVSLPATSFCWRIRLSRTWYHFWISALSQIFLALFNVTIAERYLVHREMYLGIKSLSKQKELNHKWLLALGFFFNILL